MSTGTPRSLYHLKHRCAHWKTPLITEQSCHTSLSHIHNHCLLFTSGLTTRLGEKVEKTEGTVIA